MTKLHESHFSPFPFSSPVIPLGGRPAQSDEGKSRFRIVDGTPPSLINRLIKNLSRRYESAGAATTKDLKGVT